MTDAVIIGKPLPTPKVLYHCDFEINTMQLEIKQTAYPALIQDAGKLTINPNIKQYIQKTNTPDKEHPEIIKVDAKFIWANEEQQEIDRKKAWECAEKQILDNVPFEPPKQLPTPTTEEEKIKKINEYIDSKSEESKGMQLVITQYANQNASKKVENMIHQEYTQHRISKLALHENEIKIDGITHHEKMYYYPCCVNYPVTQDDVRLIIIGGTSKQLAIEQCYIYKDKEITSIPPMKEPRVFPGVAICNGFVAVIGGDISIGIFPRVMLDSIEILDVRDISKPNWNKLNYKLHTPRSHCGACFGSNNRLYVIGGKCGDIINQSNPNAISDKYVESIEEITIKSLTEAEGKEIQIANSLLKGCRNCMCSLINDKEIIIFGGEICVAAEKKIVDDDSHTGKVRIRYNELMNKNIACKMLNIDPHINYQESVSPPAGKGSRIHFIKDNYYKKKGIGKIEIDKLGKDECYTLMPISDGISALNTVEFNSTCPIIGDESITVVSSHLPHHELEKAIKDNNQCEISVTSMSLKTLKASTMQAKLV